MFGGKIYGAWGSRVKASWGLMAKVWLAFVGARVLRVLGG